MTDQGPEGAATWLDWAMVVLLVVLVAGLAGAVLMGLGSLVCR
jgi:hypothetical protein